MTATMRAPDRRRLARKAAAEAVAERRIKLLTPREIRYEMLGGSAAADARAEAVGGTI